VFVNVLVFLLGFFLDFFEIAFILVPLLVPVVNKLGIDPVWFGIVLAMNLQTSFLTPPFGFALFYLRSVAPKQAYTDRVTRRRIEGIRTLDIYRGSIVFVLIQVTMVVVLIAFPQLATFGLEKPVDVDLDQIRIEVQGSGDGWGQPGSGDGWGSSPAADDAADPNRPGIQSGW
jgi:TRAP-type mannitol/chloroaromatic compound transport system permease large subunit